MDIGNGEDKEGEEEGVWCHRHPWAAKIGRWRGRCNGRRATGWLLCWGKLLPLASSTRPEPVFEELAHCLLLLSVHSRVNLFIKINWHNHVCHCFRQWVVISLIISMALYQFDPLTFDPYFTPQIVCSTSSVLVTAWLMASPILWSLSSTWEPPTLPPIVTRIRAVSSPRLTRPSNSGSLRARPRLRWSAGLAAKRIIVAAITEVSSRLRERTRLSLDASSNPITVSTVEDITARRVMGKMARCRWTSLGEYLPDKVRIGCFEASPCSCCDPAWHTTSNTNDPRPQRREAGRGGLESYGEPTKAKVEKAQTNKEGAPTPGKTSLQASTWCTTSLHLWFSLHKNRLQHQHCNCIPRKPCLTIRHLAIWRGGRRSLNGDDVHSSLSHTIASLANVKLIQSLSTSSTAIQPMHGWQPFTERIHTIKHGWVSHSPFWFPSIPESRRSYFSVGSNRLQYSR